VAVVVEMPDRPQVSLAGTGSFDFVRLRLTSLRMTRGWGVSRFLRVSSSRELDGGPPVQRAFIIATSEVARSLKLETVATLPT